VWPRKRRDGQYPFLLTVPIILASILFDRASGFLTTAPGVVAAASQMDWRPSVVGYLTVLTFFAIIGLLLAAFCEGLRKVLERGPEGEASSGNRRSRDAAWSLRFHTAVP
jgi:hypothetical protein